MKRLIVFVILAALLLTGCSGTAPITQQTYAMDTLMTFTVWSKDGYYITEALSSLMDQLESEWSATDNKSIISKLNRGETVELDDEQKAFLEQVEALSVRTRGAFDPKLYSISEAWGFFGGDTKVPSAEMLETALKDEKWDLGAAVKGYAGQQAVALLEELGVERALLNLGGNVQTFGQKKDGSPWQIGIEDPDGSQVNLGVLSVEGTASIVTSGDYERYIELDGKRYHHIMDPETGCPAESGLRSVTVISRDGLTADALSTALFVMGLEEGAEFWRESDDFEAVFVLTTGEIYATEGANLSGCEFEVISREK